MCKLGSYLLYEILSTEGSLKNLLHVYVNCFDGGRVQNLHTNEKVATYTKLRFYIKVYRQNITLNIVLD